MKIKVMLLLSLVLLAHGCTVPVMIGAHVAGYAASQASASGKAKITKVDESIYDINVRHNSLKSEEEIYTQLKKEAKVLCKTEKIEYITRGVKSHPIFGKYGVARIKCG